MVELGGSRFASCLGALGGSVFRFDSRRSSADELGGLGDRQCFDFGEVAARLLSASAPLRCIGLGDARPLVPEDTAMQGGALVRPALGPTVLLAVGTLGIPVRVGNSRVGVGPPASDSLGPERDSGRRLRDTAPPGARRVLGGTVLVCGVGCRAVGGAFPEPACVLAG